MTKIAELRPKFGFKVDLAQGVTTTIQGELSISSKLGKGSIFTLRFPKKEQPKLLFSFG
ncbi:hypothetical protein [Grimontia marina]|uniref:Uncharacterized protein n=1 Tax=Grimontia marina TaxID=646534 RepID=A0A128FHM4_9GAMM|nr:hypothetical protein [Grimontia marina]CZF86005.1 hypothetical protein GMA8713_04038 [Grimontia marina]